MNLPPMFLALFVAVLAIGVAVVALVWALDARRADLRRVRRPAPEPIQLTPAIAIPAAWRKGGRSW